MYNYYPSYDLDRNGQTNWNTNSNYYSTSTQELYPEAQDDRFFFAPFLVGGLAGTALGYGIANNNQLNHQGCCGQPMVFIPQQPYMYQQSMYQQPQQPYMYSSTSNNNYYY